jgi:AAA domain/DnaB-like helicase N terminal domain
MTDPRTAQEPPPHNIEAEQNALGSWLSGAPWDPGAIEPEDFFSPTHRLICSAVAALAGEGQPHDPITVSEQLQRNGYLEVVGGLARLSELARDTLQPDHVRAYSDIVAEKARLRRLERLGSKIGGAIADGATSHQIAKALQPVLETFAESADSAPKARSIVLRHLGDIVEEAREPDWFRGLEKILERKVMAILAGSRGTFKSFIALHWALLAALNKHPSIILSAEGGGLDRRTQAWMRHYAPTVDLRDLPIVAVERALNLNNAETFTALDQAITAWGATPELVLIDTLSKYAPGVDENDNTAVALYLTRLSNDIRHRYGSTVLLVAHSGHGDSRRPRGASVLMANPDSEYIVERPDPTGMAVTVTRERFKDSPSLPPLNYAAELVDLGRKDRHGDPVTSLVIRDADATAVVATAAKTPELRGAAQRQLLNALRARKSDGAVDIWTIGDLREIGRKAGMSKGTARSAAEALTFSPYLQASVGGWRLKDE